MNNLFYLKKKGVNISLRKKPQKKSLKRSKSDKKANKKIIAVLIICIIIIISAFLITTIVNHVNHSNPENGIWVLPQNMNSVDFTQLKDNGINNIYLHHSAIDEKDQQEIELWIQNATLHGIKVHIWVPIFYNNGKWILPEDENGTINQTFIDQKLEDISHYAQIKGISGIQLDYMRFPENADKYPNPDKPITDFAKKAHDRIILTNPTLQLSITIMPETYLTFFKNYNAYGQNYKELSSIADNVVIMMYKGNYHEDSVWIKDTTNWFVDNSKGAHVIIGLQGYNSENNISSIPVDELSNDVKAVFDGGSNSVSLFRYKLTNIINITKIFEE